MKTLMIQFMMLACVCIAFGLQSETAMAYAKSQEEKDEKRKKEDKKPKVTAPKKERAVKTAASSSSATFTNIAEDRIIQIDTDNLGRDIITVFDGDGREIGTYYNGY